jgi:hypothetical protein
MSGEGDGHRKLALGSQSGRALPDPVLGDIDVELAVPLKAPSSPSSWDSPLSTV